MIPNINPANIHKKDNSVVYNMDCVEGMKHFPDNCFDLVIVDTPYGIGEDGRKNHTRGKLTVSKDYRERSRYDNEPPNQDYFDELFRVSKNQIIFGANHFISKIPFDSSCWIVWDKLNGETDFADVEMAWTSFNRASRKFSFRWSGMLQGNMLRKQDRIHLNEKPFELYNWLLEKYAKPGDKILDTHLGSQSHRIAAYKKGFDFTAFETDPDYFADGNARFLKEIALPLFDAAPEYKQLSFA